MSSDSVASSPDLARPNVRRRFNSDWLNPFDTAPAYLARAKVAAAVSHPNLNPPLDAGVDQDELFVVVAPIDGADLQTLIDDIGPMPVLLAAEYARQAANGLTAAHAVGVTHGDVRPAHLVVGPLVPMSKPKADGSPRFRPGPTATVRVNELGLIPIRAKAADWPPDWDKAYLPPERFTANEHNPAGDVAMLGGVLEFLLTGRPPGSGPLAAIRPDTPPELVAVVERMRATDPAARPAMAEAADQLDRVIQLVKSPAPTPPDPDAFDLSGDGEIPTQVTPPVGWTAHPVSATSSNPITLPAWDPTGTPDDPPAVSYRRSQRGLSRKTVWLLVGAFVLMNLLAVVIWLVVLSK